VRADRPFQELNDEELAGLAREGNIEARNDLYFRHRRRIGRMAGRVKSLLGTLAGGDMSIEAQDLDQQAFLVFCDLLDKWNPARAPFAAYLSSVLDLRLSHYVRDSTHRRARTKVTRLPQPWTAEAEGLPVGEPADSPLERFLSELESTDAWVEHTRALAAPLQRCLSLRFEHELSTGEVAAVVGRSTRSVNRHLRAAMARYMENLEEEWESCA
jgi:RNA polymerase sigma factor (sigma-70 family)